MRRDLFFYCAILIIFALGTQQAPALDLTKERPFDPNAPADNKYGLPIPADELTSGSSSLVSPSFAYCRWGNRQSSAGWSLGGPPVSLSFSYLTQAPYSSASKDLFIIKSLTSVEKLSLPTSGWSAPSGTGKGNLSYEPIETPLLSGTFYLMRKLHFSPRLEAWSPVACVPVPSDSRKLIVLIHGWNPTPKNDFYSQDPNDSFTKLATALHEEIGSNSGWNLVGYHWEADADTGEAFMGDDWFFHNAPEAGEIAYQHGYHLGELLKARCPNLENVHFIAHSAGSWAARSATRYLLENMPGVKVQVTLLDPFIPQIVNSASKLSTGQMEKLDTLVAGSSPRLFRLENYYAGDSLTGNATSELFAWRLEDINRRIDLNATGGTISRFNSHSGPIDWLTETTVAPSNDPGGNSSDPGHGWGNSMFQQEPTFVLQPPSDKNVVSGTTAVLTGSAICRSGDSVRYRWYKDGQPLNDGDGGGRIAGAINETLQIDSVTGTDNGNYELQATHAGLITSSNNTALTVTISGTTGAPVIVRQPASKQVQVGSAVTFTVSAGGTTPLTYQWLRNGTSITSATNSSYSLAATSMTDNGAQFSVTVSNADGTQTSSSATLTVTAIPSSNSDPYEPNDNSTAAATLATGQIAQGYISSTSDVDWFKITVATSGMLNVSLSVPAQVDYDLELYGPDGTWVAGSYNNAGLSENISYNAATTGNYYVRVYGHPVGNGSFSTSMPYSLNNTLCNEVSAQSLSVASFGTQVIPVGFDGMRFSQIASGSGYSVALKYDGSVVAWGDNYYGQSTVPSGLNGIVQVAAGEHHVVSLRSDGTVVAWGRKADGITKVPVGLNSVVQISAGGSTTAALKSDGSVVTWGSFYSDDEWPVPAGLSGVVQIAVGSRHLVALKSDGNIVAWGYNAYGQCNVPTSLSGVIQVAAGGYHTVVLKSDGSVIAWGSNSQGQCNVPDGLNGVVQVAALVGCSVALKSDGTVIAWGSNRWGECNVPSGLNGVVQVAGGEGMGGGYNTIVLKSDGSLVTWGNNFNGKCIVPGSLTDIVQVAAGNHHNVALRSDGSVVAWGGNSSFGDGNVPSGLTGVAQVAAGWRHSVALKSDGTVVTWGWTIYGCTTPPAGLSGVVQVAGGDDHTVALKSDGNVVVWGWNIWDYPSHAYSVSLGLNGVDQVAAVGGTTLALKSDGSLVSAHKDEASNQWNVNTGLTGVVQVAAGYGSSGDCSVVLKSDGSVVAWGGNGFGQSAVPNGLSGVVQVAAEGDHTVALKSDGTMVAWGANSYGQCTIPSGLTGVVQVAAGGNTVGVGRTVVLYHSLSSSPAPLSILVNPYPRVVANNSSVTFTTSNTQTGGNTYQWQRNGVDIFAATNPDYTIASVAESNDKDLITVRITNGSTSITSTPVLLRVILPPPSITTPVTMPGGVVGSTYNQVLAASGGAMPYTWTRISGSLPSGLSLSSDGAVSGIPSAAGTFNFAVRVAGSNGASSTQNFSLVVLGVPEIVVEQPVGTNLADGGAKGFSPVAVGSSNQLAFTIKNTGTANLTGLATTKDGPNTADFIVGSVGATTLAPGSSTTFTITFAPTAFGTRTAAIHIVSNDADENPFDINLSGTGLLPEIAVEQPNGVSLADGGAKDFGSVAVGSSNQLTFTIKNTGTANLTGLTITRDGTNWADFSVSVNPAAPVTGPTGSSSFTVLFRPGGTGTRSASIHIASNDDDENPFDIVLTGTGTGSPEIAVQQPAGTELKDGVSSESFGSVAVKSAATKTFTIKNTGTADLTGLTITRDGTNAAEFTVTTNPVAPVGPSGHTTFTVRFAPRLNGTRSASIHIASNDGDENPFDIVLSGTGTGSPEIAVQQPAGTELKDGLSSKSFGSIAVKSTVTKTFTIKNTGTANLTSLAITKNGANAKDFKMKPPLKNTLAPGASTRFKVTFKPSAKGIRKAAIHIKSNDSNESSFDIALTGQGVSTRFDAGLAESTMPAPHISGKSDDKTASFTSSVRILGQKFRCVTIPKNGIDDPVQDSVEVSPNLVDWFSGPRHTTVVKDSAEVLKVRDNIPTQRGRQRFIRVK